MPQPTDLRILFLDFPLQHTRPGHVARNIRHLDLQGRQPNLPRKTLTTHLGIRRARLPLGERLHGLLELILQLPRRLLNLQILGTLKLGQHLLQIIRPRAFPFRRFLGPPPTQLIVPPLPLPIAQLVLHRFPPLPLPPGLDLPLFPLNTHHLEFPTQLAQFTREGKHIRALRRRRVTECRHLRTELRALVRRVLEFRANARGLFPRLA